MDVRSLVNDARVLLAQLQVSRWSQMHVRTPQGEIFIGRPGAGPNPMRATIGPGPEAAGGTLIRAPHVGTVIELLPAGTAVTRDAVICTLAVLDVRIEVRSPESGILADTYVKEGGLVEHETALATIVPVQ